MFLVLARDPAWEPQASGGFYLQLTITGSPRVAVPYTEHESMTLLTNLTQTVPILLGQLVYSHTVQIFLANPQPIRQKPFTLRKSSRDSPNFPFYSP